MEPARIRDDVDPSSREYRRNLIIVIGILLFLTVTGGTCLGYKIRGAERAAANAEQTEQTEQAPQDEQTEYEKRLRKPKQATPDRIE